MKRQVDLKDISDGNLYDLNDMVKADCCDCQGCSDCCRGMGNTVVLDPLDIYRMCGGLNCSFQQLLASGIELNVCDGVILPNLKMSGETEQCTYLNSEGRCRIHPYRPGICRLFPLGRFYEGDSFRYFLQTHECRKENRTKVKVRKWIDTPDLKRNQKFIADWHYFLCRVQEMILGKEQDIAKNINLYLLSAFYLTPYDKEQDFYDQFYQRFEKAEQEIGKAGD